MTDLPSRREALTYFSVAVGEGASVGPQWLVDIVETYIDGRLLTADEWFETLDIEAAREALKRRSPPYPLEGAPERGRTAPRWGITVDEVVDEVLAAAKGNP